MDIGDKVYPTEFGSNPAIEDMYEVTGWDGNFKRMQITNILTKAQIITDPRCYKMYKRPELPKTRAELDILDAKSEERRVIRDAKKQAIVDKKLADMIAARKIREALQEAEELANPEPEESPVE